jgi:ABC-2 type transport system permease protein
VSSRPNDVSTATTEPQPYGEVFDRGYQHYEGRREGRPYAIRALVTYSLRRGLGLKERWTAKLIPFALYAVAFVPVIGFIGVKAIAGPIADRFGLGYADLYDVLAMIILLFAAVAAPQMLCNDRRYHVLHLYFSRALRRSDYLLAKVGALGILIGSIAFLPALVLFLGNVFLAPDQMGYLADNVGDVGRIVALGLVIALFYTCICLVVAAYVDRQSIAAAISVGGILIVGAVASALFEAIDTAWRGYLMLVNPIMIPEALTRWVFDSSLPVSSPIAQAGLDGKWYLATVVALAVISGVVMYRRYLLED